MPVLMISSVVLGLVVVIALFRRGLTVAAWLALVGLILLGAVNAVTLAVEVPIDNQVKTWTTATFPRTGRRSGPGGRTCTPCGRSCRWPVSQRWSRPR